MEGVIVSARKDGSTITISVVSDDKGDLLILKHNFFISQYGRHVAGVVRDEDGGGVAQPDVAEVAGNDLDAVDAGQQRSGGPYGLIAAHQQPHALSPRPGQGPGQGGDLGLRRRQIFQPQLRMARKSEPQRPVGRPFGGDGRVHGGLR